MKTGKTQGYVLTFRCINCGKHEVFAQYPTESIEFEEQIRARIYQVRCNSCGWSGDACGLSAIRMLHTTELKARAAGQGLGLGCDGRSRGGRSSIDKRWPGATECD